MRRGIFLFIMLLCLLVPSAARASVDVKNEPSATKSSANYWYLNWSVPGSSNSANAFIRWTLRSGADLVMTSDTDCLANCSGEQSPAGGSESIMVPGLTDGARYSMCAELYRYGTSGTPSIDRDCIGGVTRIDTSPPVVAKFGFASFATDDLPTYVTNGNQAFPVRIWYEDLVSPPWPSNSLKVTFKNYADVAYYSSDWYRSSSCSNAWQVKALNEGWIHWDFSCTFNPQTYARDNGIALQDGTIELSVRSADSAKPADENWAEASSSLANISSPTADVIFLDRAAPTIVASADATSPMFGQSVTFDSSGSSDQVSGLDPAGWSWNWGDGAPGATTASATHTFFMGGPHTVTLTGKDNVGWAKSTTLLIDVIGPPGSPVNDMAPAVTGTARDGQTLTCLTGAWSGTPPPSLMRTWLRAGVPITGANNVTYTAQAADVGKQLACRVTAMNLLGFAIATSSAVTVAPAAPRATVAPSVTGTGTIGATLTCSKGNWTGTAPISYSYQWLKNGVAISGQTAATHRIVMAETGRNLSCRVKGANSAGSATSTSTAKRVTPVKPINTAKPKIYGTLKVGKVLSCSNGSWTGTSGITYTRQWYRGTSAISRATGIKYTAKRADKGRRLKCRVVAKNVAGSSAASSGQTGTIK